MQTCKNWSNAALVLGDSRFNIQIKKTRKIELLHHTTASWSFHLRKNFFCKMNIERAIALQISITFFFIHTVWRKRPDVTHQVDYL